MSQAPVKHRGYLIKPQADPKPDDGDKLIWLIYSPSGRQVMRHGDSLEHAIQIIDELLR